MRFRETTGRSSGGQAGVETAGTVAVEVEGDIAVAEAVQAGRHRGAEGGVIEASHLGRGGLEAGEVAVVADADLAQTAVAQVGFGGLDHGQGFTSDRGSVGQAGGEAGHGRFVGRGQPQPLGEFADIGLGEAGLEQRTAHAEFGGSAPAGAPVGGVFGVTAIQAAAQFTLFSFLVPSLKTLFSASPETTSLLLVLLGVTGVAGNIIGARLVDRIGAAQVTLYGLLSMLASHVIWIFVPGSWPLLLAFLVLLGIGCFSTNSSQQARLVMMSPPHAPVSVAMNSSAMYFGQAAGTASGAALLAGFGGPAAYTALVALSIPLFIASIAMSLLVERKKAAV